MGIFGKKEKEDEKRLPDLPSPRSAMSNERIGLPPFEGDEESDNERHVLPAFPDSPTHNRFSQAVIKDAVSHSEETTDSDEKKDFKIVEMEEWKPSLRDENSVVEPERRMLEFNEKMPMLEGTGGMKMREKHTDVFVRLDKFHSAKKSLVEIKNKLEEIDDMMRKIRETKLREEQELSAWERDILHTKARLEEITKDIFEKTE